MNKFFDKIQEPMMKLADKFNSVTILCVIRDAFFICFPIIIFGSLVTIIANFPFLSSIIGEQNAADWKALLSPASNATINALALFLCLGIGYYYAKNKECDVLFGAGICICSFIVLAPWWSGNIVAVDADGNMTGKIVAKAVSALTTDQIGAKGMFVAIFCSFLSSAIFCKLSKKNLQIKMPEQVPPAVAKSFASLIPAVLTLTVILVIRCIFTFTQWNDIFTFVYEVVQAPLVAMGSGIIPTIIAIFFVQFFWFFGLHGQTIINSCMDPIWNTLMIDNYTAYTTGEQLPHIITKPFMEVFTVGLGGSGATLIVIILIVFFARSKQFKGISKLALAPGIFNVNEPFIFGMPIIFNPLFFIPWICIPIINLCVAYYAMWFDLVPYTTGVLLPWTTPVFLNGFLATNSWQGAALQAVQMAIDGALWLPFILAIDRKMFKQENATVVVNNSGTTLPKEENNEKKEEVKPKAKKTKKAKTSTNNKTTNKSKQ